MLVTIPRRFALLVCLSLILLLTCVAKAETIKIGLNYPKTGPYAAQGQDQWNAAQLALEEINASGGILGKQIEIVWRDSMSKPDVTVANVTELIDKESVKMVFGGSASSVAVAAGKVCGAKGIPFFGTLAYANDVTVENLNPYMFRECNNSWSAAKVVSAYMSKNFPNKKYVYITADYNWGHSTEDSLRKFTATEDKEKHKSMRTPVPGAKEEDFKKAIAWAKMLKPDVVVLVLFGNDMVLGVKQATLQGLKQSTQIVVPNLTLGMAQGAGPKMMEGVIGSVPWTAQVPYIYNYARGKEFVEKYIAKYNHYPCSSGASAYTILHQYKDAVERVGTFDSTAVVKALEGHSYTLLKDAQTWRDFDHQSVQTVYAVRCKPEAQVLKDPFKQDYFEVIDTLPGDQAFQSRDEWNSQRKLANKSINLWESVAEVKTAP